MCFVLSFNGQCKEMMSADLKIVSMASLHSQILHFLIFVYIKAKTLQPKPKTIWQCFTYVSRSYDPYCFTM
jgi:hypothetical protein